MNENVNRSMFETQSKPSSHDSWKNLSTRTRAMIVSIPLEIMSLAHRADQTLRPNALTYDPPPTEEARLRCDLWISCDLEYCRKHGCVNALMQNRKELRL